MPTFSEINDATGFANGEKFHSKQEVHEYFTVENMREIFPDFGQYEDFDTQITLSMWAGIVIENNWHCDFN